MRRTGWPLAAAAFLLSLSLPGSAAAAPAPAAARPSRAPVVFVVVPDLRWSTAPGALTGWARASLAVNSVDRQRAVDVYLTIGKGRRTNGPGSVSGPGPVDSGPDGATLRWWPRLVAHDTSLRYGGHLGELGDELARHGVAVTVVGGSPVVAALGADRAGRVRRFVGGGAAEVGEALREARLVAVESAGPDVTALLDATAGTCRVVATGSLPAGPSHLGAVAVSPECGLGRRGLISPSTRRAGYVTLPDLAPTLLSLVGVDPPNVFEGGAVRAAAADPSRRRLVDEDHRSAVSQDAGKPFTTVFLLAAAIALLGLVRERLRLPLAAVLLGLPPALLLVMLVPWWKAGVLAGVAVLVAVAALLGGVARRAAGGDPARTVLLLTTATVALLTLDALRGGPWELDAPMVNNAIAAGRFAGIGNVPYGFLVASALGVGGLVLQRYGRRVLPGVAAGLGVVVVADGAPMFGADVGGLLTTLPAAGVLLAAWRGRVSRLVVVVSAVAGLVVVAALAAFEVSRPARQQNHLGRTLAGGPILSTAARRGLAAADSFRTSPWVLVAAVAVAGLVAARRRLPPGSALRAAFGAMGVAAVLGTGLNDSGVAVGGAVAFVAWAMILALAQPGSSTGSRPDAATSAPGGGAACL